MAVKISSVVICYNEEENIEKCLKSLLWTDEIIVVDSFSTDNTVAICRKFIDRVYQRKWPGHKEQKAYAVTLAKNNWVLALDADEMVTEGLRKEIAARLSSDGDQYDGYLFKRHTYYLNRWINHGGWYPDYKLRVFKKDKVYIGGENPHDKYFVNGPVKRLNEEIIHYTYKNIFHQLQTIDRFSAIASQEMLKRNVSFILPKMLFKPPLKFLETYFYKLGLLDGAGGFIIAVLTSYYTFLKFAKLWEKKNILRNA